MRVRAGAADGYGRRSHVVVGAYLTARLFSKTEEWGEWTYQKRGGATAAVKRGHRREGAVDCGW